jgi:hypothetical protein
VDPRLKYIRFLYGKLLRLYPREFREQLGESMAQTFDDLVDGSHPQPDRGWTGLLLGTFIETAIGIAGEYLLLITEGNAMRNMLKTSGLSALTSLLLILPFMIMEVVNRQNFNEDFPVTLFFVMWLNLFAVILILLPIVLSWRAGKAEMANPASAQGDTLLTNPRSTALISVALILSLGMLPLLDSLGWLSTDLLFNGPNPEVAYLPGQILGFGLILFPIAAGVIAARPIVNTLRGGGGLFAHPINLIIVAFLVTTFALGFGSFMIDQWPCFIGVPNCD